MIYVGVCLKNKKFITRVDEFFYVIDYE